MRAGPQIGVIPDGNRPQSTTLTLLRRALSIRFHDLVKHDLVKHDLVKHVGGLPARSSRAWWGLERRFAAPGLGQMEYMLYRK